MTLDFGWPQAACRWNGWKLPFAWFSWQLLSTLVSHFL